MKFQGTVEYTKGEGTLSFSEFRVSVDELFFRAQSTTHKNGLWVINGVARRTESKLLYAVTGLKARQGSVESVPVKLTFEINVSHSRNGCHVSGIWSEARKDWHFIGELPADNTTDIPKFFDALKDPKTLKESSLPFNVDRPQPPTVTTSKNTSEAKEAILGLVVLVGILSFAYYFIRAIWRFITS